MVCKRVIDTLYHHPSEETIKNIKNQLNEDDGRLKHSEDLLEQWFHREAHLPKNYDRKMVRTFLRGAKFNLDTTKRKLENYFTTKCDFVQLYTGRAPESSDIKKVFDNVNIVNLPEMTENGDRIWVMSLVHQNSDHLDMVATIKLFLMLYDLSLTCEFPMASEIFIFDCTYFSPSHLVKFLQPIFRDSICILRDAYASRISQIHVVNCPPIVEKLLTVVRPLLPEKVKKRFMVHTGTSTLLQHIPSKILPSDIGGNLDNLREYMKMWQKLATENADWFKQQESATIVGAPPKKIHKFTHDLSLEGSFRQLNID